MSNSVTRILGIPFFNGNVSEVFNHLRYSGGLLTVPAAPALVTIKEDPTYYHSLLHSDIIIPDSGYMVILWNLFNKEKIRKISGLEFINFFLESFTFVDKSSLMLINPSDDDGDINCKFLNNKGFYIDSNCLYTAPFYRGVIKDDELLNKIELLKPKWILINIGGGTQEKLGYYLKTSLSYCPAIVCTGAALAFKTGRQASIPSWADYLYLGWLSRCIHQPRLFIPRYLKAFKLIYLILKYKSNIVS